MSDTGLEGLLAGEVKGVPVSVSLELSRWLLSREMRLELPPLELRFNSAMLCGERRAEGGGQSGNKATASLWQSAVNLTLFFLCTSSGGRYWWSCFFFTCVASIFMPSFSMLMLLACLYTATLQRVSKGGFL